jgi:CRP/FNR family transcriptional regulator
MEIYEILKTTDLFHELSGETLKNLAQDSRIKLFKPKEILFHQGFEGENFFINLSGNIKVFKTSAEGKETVIKILQEGEFFAEAVLFGKNFYPASAVAMNECKVVVIHRRAFFRMLENSKARNIFIASLFNKLRYLTGKIHQLTSFDIEERFFKYLLENYGRKYQYEILISKKDFSHAIGTIPETFSRLIQRLTRRGVIKWDKKNLSIKQDFWDDEFYQY